MPQSHGAVAIRAVHRRLVDVAGPGRAPRWAQRAQVASGGVRQLVAIVALGTALGAVCQCALALSHRAVLQAPTDLTRARRALDHRRHAALIARDGCIQGVSIHASWRA